MDVDHEAAFDSAIVDAAVFVADWQRNGNDNDDWRNDKSVSPIDDWCNNTEYETDFQDIDAELREDSTARLEQMNDADCGPNVHHLPAVLDFSLDTLVAQFHALHARHDHDEQLDADDEPLELHVYEATPAGTQATEESDDGSVCHAAPLKRYLDDDYSSSGGSFSDAERGGSDGGVGGCAVLHSAALSALCAALRARPPAPLPRTATTTLSPPREPREAAAHTPGDLVTGDFDG